MICGLCESEKNSLFYRDEPRGWDYYLCQDCDLIFRDPETYLSHDDEKQRYASHNNSMENKGYVEFLKPCVETLKPYLQAGQVGLDFGSGPGPIIDKLFAKENIIVKNYDPYFDYHPHLLDEKYDFVTCTETFEHFTVPFKEMAAMTAALKPKAYLLLMTEMHQDLEHFKNWGYRMDPTHICFLSSKSLDWLADHWGYDVLSAEGRIFLLQKKS